MPSLDLPDNFVIYDLEWTAWEGSRDRLWTGPGEVREIIAIGAVLIATSALKMVSTFDQLITLESVPELPAYTTALTGITTKQLNDRGRHFTTALAAFAAFTGGQPIYCWGYDHFIIAENCVLKKTPYPFRPDLTHDIRFLFSRQGIAAEKYFSSTITEAFGQPSRHRGHYALADALNILDALRLLNQPI